MGCTQDTWTENMPVDILNCENQRNFMAPNYLQCSLTLV